MKTQKVSINTITSNPDNPRLIRDEKFNKLVKSIETFPEMLKLRPIIVDEDNVILGGNMRYEAQKHLGINEVYVVKAEGLTDEQKQEFIIKDNVGFGEWDWNLLSNEWEAEKLLDWGLDVWQPNETEDDLEDFFKESETEDVVDDDTVEINLVYDLEKGNFIKDKLKTIDEDYSKAVWKLLEKE